MKNDMIWKVTLCVCVCVSDYIYRHIRVNGYMRLDNIQGGTLIIKSSMKLVLKENCVIL